MSASAPRVLLLGFGAIGRQLVTLFDPSEFEVSAFVRDVSDLKLVVLVLKRLMTML